LAHSARHPLAKPSGCQTHSWVCTARPHGGALVHLTSLLSSQCLRAMFATSSQRSEKKVEPVRTCCAHLEVGVLGNHTVSGCLRTVSRGLLPAEAVTGDLQCRLEYAKFQNKKAGGTFSVGGGLQNGHIRKLATPAELLI